MNFDLLLQLVLMLATTRHFVTAQSSHFGKSFIVALPKMTSKPNYIFNTPSVVFLLTTAFPDVKVSIASRWFVDKALTLKETVRLSAFEVNEYTLNQTFNHQINTGYIHSFELTAKREFTLSVALLDSITSIATFLAVPVERWGKVYFAVTLGHLITMTLIGDRGPNLIIIRLKSANKNFALTINNNELRRGQLWSFTLSNNQAFVISTCDSSQFVGTITGTKVSGDKEFGLVTGNCYARSKSYDCKNMRDFKWGFGDIAAEMIPPYETYGRDFITFDVVRPSSGGFYFIVAGDDQTVVTINEGHSKAVDTFTLPYSGSWIEKNILVSRVTSSKGILMVFVRRSPCTEKYNDTHYLPGEKGAPSLSFIVPTALFYFSYIFKIPRFVTNYNYVVVIVKRQFARFTMLNDAAIKVERWRSIPGGQGWAYGYSRVARNINYTMTSERSFFGCYLYGHDLTYAYMHPAGYIVGKINAQCTKDVSKMKEGDLIDNDCDGIIDEEYLNEKDDDGDNEIDEDLNTFKGVRDTPAHHTEMTTDVIPDQGGPTTMVHPTEFQNPLFEKDVDFQDYDNVNPSVIEPVDPGLVSNWLEWQCDPSCADSRMFRERICLRPPIDSDCIESLREYRAGRCDKMCSDDDAVCGRFGDYSHWSEWSCARNCSEARKIRTRQCQSSKTCTGNLAEWTRGSCYLKTTCPDACPKFKWDVNCLQSCENCVKDCDKFTGICGACVPGYLDPSTSCQKSCPEFTYGRDCKLNCVDKCSEDCRDRGTGECYDKYEQWQEWHCSKSCIDSSMYRERTCDSSKSNSVCLGPKTEMRQGMCYLDHTCPLNCDIYAWGDDCVQSCKHCDSDCDKFTGECQHCKPGFKNPRLGCVEGCGRNEYGFNCKGDCFVKCGADCEERVHGHCHSGYEKLALLILLLFMFLPCVYILFRDKKSDPHLIRPRSSSYFGKIGLMVRRVPYSTEYGSKSQQDKSKKTNERQSAGDDFSLSSYEDDDDDDEDD